MAARTGPSGGAGAYADCVDSLRSSLKFLEASVETIDRGVSDFPRMVGVLKTVRVCTSSSSNIRCALSLTFAYSTTNSFRNRRLLRLRPPSEMRLDPTLPFCSAVPTLELSARNAALRLSKLVPSCSRDGLLGQMNQYVNLPRHGVDSSVARTSFARG